MSLRIGLDVDGVLANFRAAFQEFSVQCLGHDIRDAKDLTSSDPLADQDVERVWAHIGRTTNWWMHLQPYEQEEIARLYDLTRAATWEVFFLTKRPPSAGDSVQFQTQWWLERQGFYLPSVVTVPGSRGELANALRLDIVIDDLMLNCIEVVSASSSKAILMARDANDGARRHALDRGVGVVSDLAEALGVLEQVQDLLPRHRGRLMRLSEWFKPKGDAADTLPHNPRVARPLPNG